MAEFSKMDLQHALKKHLEAVTGIIGRRLDDLDESVSGRLTLSEQAVFGRIGQIDRQLEALALHVSQGFETVPRARDAHS
jgi:hypothetical protein